MSKRLDPRQLAIALAAGRSGSARFLAALLEQRSACAVLDAAAVERFVALGQDPSTVVFVAVHHGNFPTLEYFAEVLRCRGRRAIVIYLQGTLPASGFDAVLQCEGSLGSLAAVLSRLPARPIYLQAHGRWAFLSQWIDAVHPGLRVVQELWDWMDAFVEPGREGAFVDAGLFDADELATIRGAENWARTRTAAFVHKHGGAALDAVVADHTVPELRFFPCPPRAWMRPPQARARDRWRLVHAGQLKPSTSPRAVFGDLQYLPMIGTLTAQGCAVAAYAGAGGSHDEYIAAAESNPAFTFHPRVEVRELVDALHGRHDFGLLLYHFAEDLAVGPRHLQTALASKLFVYLAAGLPVLVSPELAFMAEFVRTHGIGLVVDAREIATLTGRLDACDYPALVAAVARAQHTFCAEHTVDDVVALLEEVGR